MTSWRQQWRDDIRDADDPALDVYAKGVAFALDRFMETADGGTTTGRRRLAQLAGIKSHGTVHDRLDRLVTLGWLTREWDGRGARAVHRLAYPVGHPRHAEWRAWAAGVVRGTDQSHGGVVRGTDQSHDTEWSAPRAQVVRGTTESGPPGRPDPDRPRNDDPAVEREPRGTHELDDEPAALSRSSEDASGPDPLAELAAELTSRTVGWHDEVPGMVRALATETDPATVAAWLDDDPDAGWQSPSRAADAFRAWVAARGNGTDPADLVRQLWDRPAPAPCEDLPDGEHCNGLWHWRDDVPDDTTWHCPRRTP